MLASNMTSCEPVPLLPGVCAAAGSAAAGQIASRRQSDRASHSVLALPAGMAACPASSDASICSRLRPFVSGTIRATNASAAMLSRA